jgi:cathepsin B
MGCNGGYPEAAWEFFHSNGLVTEAVYPYAFPECEHHINGTKPPCPSSQPTPKCDKSKLTSKRYYGKSAYSVPSSVEEIQREIMTKGPVEIAISVYQDFLAYKTGVYSHTTGSFLGGHAVRMLGWGVDNGTPYWLVANSWNEDWGDHGYIKIKRGVDECGIESSVVAGDIDTSRV